MGIFFNRNGRGSSQQGQEPSSDQKQNPDQKPEQKNDTELDKGSLPSGHRYKSVDHRKGGELLVDKNFGKRPNDFGRDALLDATRQAKPEMMAMVSVLIPELSSSKSPQAAALLKAFENPAIVRSYLINPQATAEALGKRFPDMKDELLKNAPFKVQGQHLEPNQKSGLYDRIKQEVDEKIKPNESFVRKQMDGLLTSAVPAAIGGSSGMETKAYELLRNKIEKPNFNKQALRTELRISNLMNSPQARQDLKEAQGLAAMGPLREAPVAQRPAPQTGGVPTVSGETVQGPLKPVQEPKVTQTTATPAMRPQVSGGTPTTDGKMVQGVLTPVQMAVTPAPGIAAVVTAPPNTGVLPKSLSGTAATLGPKIPVPNLAIPMPIPTTSGVKIEGTLKPVTPLAPPQAPQAPSPAPSAASVPPIPAQELKNPTPIPTTNGAKVEGTLKPVTPLPTPQAPQAPSPAPGAASVPPIPAQELRNPAAIPTTNGAKIEGTLKQVAPPPPQAPQGPAPQAAATPAPDPKNQPAPQTPPAPAPADQKLAQENKAMKETVAKLEADLKKNADSSDTILKQLKESQAANDALMKRVALNELKGEVNDQFREQKQRIATSTELNAAVSALSKAEQKDLPAPEQVVAKVSQMRQDVSNKITTSIQSLPSDASIVDARAWSKKNMDLYQSLDNFQKQEVVTFIQRNYKFGKDMQTFDPSQFFDRKVADSVALAVKKATYSETVYVPPSAPGTSGTRVTYDRPDPLKVSEVLRSVSDLPQILPYVAAHPDVKAVRDKLPTTGIFFKEAGVAQQSLDARLRGDTKGAEAYLIRSLIDSPQVQTSQGRQQIREALMADPEKKAAIAEFYKATYGTDFTSDIKKANASQIARAAEAEQQLEAVREKAKKELAAAEQKANELKNNNKDLLD